MNTAPKNKTLIIIIAILLIANIATLSFFLMNKCGTKSGRQDKKAMIANYLSKEVGFNAEQLKRYDTLSKQQRSAMRSSLDGMSAGREEIFRKLASQEFSDSAIDNAANAITIQQRSFEVLMLHHLDDIRNICTPAQKLAFDTGFYKIISKRGEGKRN
ncbi:hypothetical protein BH11BAC4_BH11BAC4_07990 [soil metagenome]